MLKHNDIIDPYAGENDDIPILNKDFVTRRLISKKFVFAFAVMVTITVTLAIGLITPQLYTNIMMSLIAAYLAADATNGVSRHYYDYKRSIRTQEEEILSPKSTRPRSPIPIVRPSGLDIHQE